MKNFLAALLLSGVSIYSSAAITTYTDRAAFEAQFSTFTVDSLNGINASFHFADTRADYAISTGSMYGCINESGCGNNTNIGADNAYIWMYEGAPATFTFNNAVNGFGFNFSAPNGWDDTKAIINGNTSSTTSGFYGLISTNPLSSFIVGQTAQFMVIDNVTYSSDLISSTVPEPTTVALLGLGLLGFAASRRKSANGKNA